MGNKGHAAIIVEKGISVPSTQRLKQKLRGEGVIAAFRSLLYKVRLVAPSPSSRSVEKTMTVKPQQLCSERGIPIWMVQSVNTPEAVRIISSLAVNVGGGIRRLSRVDVKYPHPSTCWRRLRDGRSRASG